MAIKLIEPDPNLKTVILPPYQPSLFDKPLKITLAPMAEGIQEKKDAQKSAKKRKKKPLDKKSSQKLSEYQRWRKLVEKELCPYADTKEKLKASEEFKVLIYNLEQSIDHYVHELGVSLGPLSDYSKANQIARMAVNLNDANAASMQKLAGGLLLDARENGNASELIFAGEAAQLAAAIRDLHEMRSGLFKGEIVPPVKRWAVEIPKKQRNGGKAAAMLLSDAELSGAFEAYMRKAEEIAKN